MFKRLKRHMEDLKETQVKLVGMKTTRSDEKGGRNSIEASEKALFLLQQVVDK